MSVGTGVEIGRAGIVTRMPSLAGCRCGPVGWTHHGLLDRHWEHRDQNGLWHGTLALEWVPLFPAQQSVHHHHDHADALDHPLQVSWASLSFSLGGVLGRIAHF